MEDKFKLIEYLLQEVKLEQQKDDTYNEERIKAEKLAKENNRHYWCYMDDSIKPTNKAKIKDYLKIIRRVTLEIEKEFDK